jgi:hypothetical protein
MHDLGPLVARVTASLSRRSFVGWLAAAVPATRARWLHGALRQQQLDEALLVALATAILPSELGLAGAGRVAGSLMQWSAGYRPGVDLNHGYGTARLRTTGPNPTTQWALQLRALDEDARRAHNSGFAAIGDDRRRALVRAHLDEERANTIPGDIAAAQHVALALLASFYGSPEAADLCYESRIGRQLCRPLSESPQRPVPLRRGGDAR